jgi:hypothetical protein
LLSNFFYHRLQPFDHLIEMFFFLTKRCCLWHCVDGGQVRKRDF